MKMPGKARILIVEDNDKNRRLFRLLVHGMGHESLVAGDGEEGVRKALEEIPDLVLMDIQMPRLDGISALARLQQDAHWQRIPVVAVTSCAMPGDRERLLNAGFSGYLAKPIDAGEFRQVVSALLQESHGDD